MQNSFGRFCVLVLTAGKGKRMHSNTPKVLQRILGEPILYYSLSAAISLGFGTVAAVVGFGGDKVEQWINSEFSNVEVVWQREQLGTGHAVKAAQGVWSRYEHVMVLAGDTPCITAETLKNFAERHAGDNNECTFISFDLNAPSGYGRIVRNGASVRVVEHKDATEEEKKICEVNSGVYLFSTKALASVIDEITRANAQKEYYLPDALALIEADGGKVEAVKVPDADEFLGVNDPAQLAEATTVIKNRILNKWISLGVRFADPAAAWIGPRVELGEDIEIEPSVQLWGKTLVGNGTRIGSFTVLTNAEIGRDVMIVGSVRIQDSKVGSGSLVGPFVLMRENTVLDKCVHIGRFVEIKKSNISAGSKIPHLSYIGDAQIGKNTNIGAGTITCNYDGFKKHPTYIGDNCFLGSDTMLIAPITLGNDVITGAGSVITEDVPDGALSVGRARQRNIEGWSHRTKDKGGK